VENSDPNAIKPRGFVDRDGAFVVFTHAAGDGAPAGEYVVTVMRPGPEFGGPGRQAPPAGRQAAAFPARGAGMKRGSGSRPPGVGRQGGIPSQWAGRRGAGASGGGWTPPVEVPARYQRPETSDLRIVVERGDNDLEPLVLTK
jgi:hypothetical protein